VLSSIFSARTLTKGFNRSRRISAFLSTSRKLTPSVPRRSRIILISPEAQRDLVDIWTEHPRQGNNRPREIDRVCARLVDDVPIEGRGRDDLASGLRSIFRRVSLSSGLGSDAIVIALQQRARAERCKV
jgi:hypothetical protein